MFFPLFLSFCLQKGFSVFYTESSFTTFLLQILNTFYLSIKMYSFILFIWHDNILNIILY